MILAKRLCAVCPRCNKSIYIGITDLGNLYMIEHAALLRLGNGDWSNKTVLCQNMYIRNIGHEISGWLSTCDRRVRVSSFKEITL